MYIRDRLSACFIIFVYIIILSAPGKSLECRDDNNKPIDWYVAYKIPKMSDSSNPLIRQGVAYLYMTSDSSSSGWQLSSKDISSKDSIAGYTLSPLYKNENSSDLWILYNDQPPNKAPATKYGHTKGVVMVSSKQGFWLIHSVPLFPSVPKDGVDLSKSSGKSEMDIPSEGKYDYPTSGKHFGQTFLCISMNKDQFDVVGQQLMYNQIVPYRINLPETLKKQYSVLADAARKKRIKNPPYNHKVSIKSLEEIEFLSFAKSDKWQKDLYDDFLAPQLGVDLLTETWLNGRGKLPSECNGSKVMNVKSVILEKANVNFKSSHDHSKWAVSNNNKKNHNWICIGDVNRADTQFNRGGGAVCFNSLNVWRTYRGSVNDIEPCPKKKFSLINWVKSWF
ncbi:plancitoxin-1 [Cephus cinctus]|uniref:Plancitoxin-1 n=1 Tax=Cephus cinctus TaxID=211228 RepID=A0AAJ7BXE3_CEPCN|nr:plancitoxin-1 [Cephus cinctus]